MILGDMDQCRRDKLVDGHWIVCLPTAVADRESISAAYNSKESALMNQVSIERGPWGHGLKLCGK